ncbi:dystroglycan, partial [Nematolebias whitei]|uniref:dystroglycan n=1 Tax=Nematolebias whitei TaxID=451745 RepID=UPI0018974639
MCNKHGGGLLDASGGLDVRLPRTRLLLLGLVLVAAGWLPPSAHADGAMVLIEAGGEGEGQGGDRSELEASMHSSLLHDFQEVTEGLQVMEDSVTTASRQDTAPPSAFPDSSAVVGRLFQIKVPNKMADVYMEDIVKVTEMGKDSLPTWLHWDASSRVLQGLPLDEDKGVNYISVTISKHAKASSSSSTSEVFSIEVHPEDHLDADSSQLLSNQAAAEDHGQPFLCSNEEPVTVLTVILDADLT